MKESFWQKPFELFYIIYRINEKEIDHAISCNLNHIVWLIAPFQGLIDQFY